MTIARKCLVAAVAAVVAVVAGLGVAQPARAGGAPFGPPVKVTPPLGGGYEPSIVIDKYNNMYATAHKENWQLVISPDPDSPTYTRSMSWDWISSDGGHTWTDLPGLSAADVEQHDFGDEGDMALDDANHLYFVDTNVADITLTRWTFTGRGKLTLDYHRPVLPSIQPLDDRPWVVAHRNGHVFYFGNMGTKAYNGGRYTVYQSYDGGQSFYPLGTALPDSGWCRPAADHRAGSNLVYAICTNDNGVLYAYVSRDNGATWTRYKIGTYNDNNADQSWPTVQVASDGSIWALYVDATKVDSNGHPILSKLRLFSSKDEGKTWSEQDVTPQPGHFDYGWITVRKDLTGIHLGLGIYFRKYNDRPWKVYGAVFSPGERPVLTSLDPYNPVAGADRSRPPGDFMSSYFGPDGKLSVIWTRIEWTTPATTLFRDIWYAQSLYGV